MHHPLRGRRLYGLLVLLLLILFALFRVTGILGRTQLFHGTGAAAAKITAAEAANHIGSYAEVTGVVADVHRTGGTRGGTTFLDFGAPYPSQSLTAVIFARDRQHFGNLDGLSGRTVQVTGRIESYRGGAQIVLTSPAQLRVLD